MLKHGSLVVALAVSLIGAFTVIAQKPRGSPEAGPRNNKLAVFVGTWKDEAERKPSPFGPGGSLTLTETCEWFTGGLSLVCHTDATGYMGDIRTLTVFNYSAEDKVYTSFELNSLGHLNFARGTVDDDTWTFSGETKMAGKLIRYRNIIKLPSPDTAVMNSELSVDGGPWTEVMELKGTRVK